MSTIFRDSTGNDLWEHHETFVPPIGTGFVIKNATLTVEKAWLEVVELVDGPMAIKQLKSFVIVS